MTELVFIVTDTNIFRYVVESGFQKKFVHVCSTLSLKIVTVIQVEREIQRYPACQGLFTHLQELGIAYEYSTPERLKTQENNMYETLTRALDDADAASIPVAILNDWLLLTNDDEAVTVFKSSFPPLFKKLKLMSFESLLYLAYQQGIIDVDEGERILAAYKSNCFESEQRQNRRIRGRNFLELVTFMHDQGISPLNFLFPESP